MASTRPLLTRFDRRMLDSMKQKDSQDRSPEGATTEAPANATVLDPVCGMEISREDAVGSYIHEGKEYFFCNPSCLENFRANPSQYLSRRQAVAPSGIGASSARPGPNAVRPYGAGATAIYTCPMHPEVVRDGPGTCPICGMALEPRTASVAEEANPELVLMTRRFWVCLALTLPIFLLAMSDMLPGQPLQHAFSARLLSLAQLALASPVVLWGGWPFFERGWASLVNRHLNMFTLIAIGTGTAYVYSLAAVLIPGGFPQSFRGAGGEVPVYFEASAVITTLVLLGQVLELRARAQTSSAIRGLLGLAPKTARVVGDDGSEHDVPLDRLTGRSGARPPGRKGARRMA